jgi:GT2 family glycosyltransferase
MQIKHHIQVVVVLYRCNITQSKSLTSLLNAKREINDLFDFDILVYNNYTPSPITPNPQFEIYNATSNEMLAGAYNYALNQANKKNIDWLLLLDQDSCLTTKYFKELYHAISNAQKDDYVACIVPRIFNGNHQLSPVKYNPILGPKWFLSGIKPGTSNKCHFAFNSATLIKTKAINKIGQFPNEYPLDDLDICYFYRLFKLGYKSIILNSKIEHQLSVLNYAQNMTPSRYNSILFYDKQMAKEIGIIAQFALFIRVLLRSIKQLFTKEKHKYIYQTIKSLFK